MTINQLIYFRAVAEEGHIGRAAEKLMIAQPSLSVSIMKLEEELGITLFDRQGHSLILTSDGKKFLEHAKRILEDYENALGHASRLAERHDKKISIGCVSPVFYEYLPEKMSLFLKEKKNKNVEILFEAGHTSELTEALKKEKYDFLLCSRVKDPDLLQAPIIREPLVFLAPENEKDGVYIKDFGWKKISSLSLVGYDDASSMGQTLKEIADEKQVTLHFSYRLPDEQSIAAFVESGLGCAIVPDTSALCQYHVKKLPLPESGYFREICLTTRKGHKYVGAAKRFIDFLGRTS